MPKDRTDKQKEASRANGRKSQGPKTPRGKTRSSLNSLKYGFNAHSLILPNESRPAYNELVHSFVTEFAPQGGTENFLVQQMISAQWFLNRIATFERIAMINAAESATDVPATVTAEGTWEEPAARDAIAFQTVHGRAGAGSVFQLSEVRYQRQFSRALNQLFKLRNFSKNEERT